MTSGDNENLEIPPAETESPSIEPKQFLVSEPPVDEAAPPSEEAGALPPPSDISAESSESVDALLSAELLPEGLETLPEPAPPLPEHPTFQLQFRSWGSMGASQGARAAMKKALDAQGVTVSEKAWAAAVPMISQLTEFQAIALLQAAQALGIVADVAVVMPGMVPSEEDLALGELSSVPEASSSELEGAPSVTLPKGEKEVLLCTPDHLPGGTVRESFGIVVAHRSIARRLFREEDLRDKLEKELRAVPNRPVVALPSSHLQMILRDLLLDLRKSALAKGANSVLGVKMEAFPESGRTDPQLEQLRLVAFGTAAIVEKS